MLNFSVSKEYKVEDKVLEITADLVTFEDYSIKYAFCTANELLYPAYWYSENSTMVAELIENKEALDEIEKAVKNIINHRAEEGPKEVGVDLTMCLNFSTKVPFNIYRINEFHDETACDDYIDEITKFFQSKIEEILSKVCEQNENISSIDLERFEIDYIEGREE